MPHGDFLLTAGEDAHDEHDDAGQDEDEFDADEGRNDPAEKGTGHRTDLLS